MEQPDFDRVPDAVATLITTMLKIPLPEEVERSVQRFGTRMQLFDLMRFPRTAREAFARFVVFASQATSQEEAQDIPDEEIVRLSSGFRFAYLAALAVAQAYETCVSQREKTP